MRLMRPPARTAFMLRARVPAPPTQRRTGERVPCRHRGARQRGSFFERQAFGNVDQSGLVEHGIFGEHSIDCATQRGTRINGGTLASNPILHENGGDAIARFHARNAGADLDDLAAAVRKRNQRQLHRCIASVHDREVPEVEGCRAYSNQHPARTRHRLIPLCQYKRINAFRFP